MTHITNYLKTFIHTFGKQNVPLFAAAQAHYYFLALFPMLIVCFTIIPYLNLDVDEVMAVIENSIPQSMASMLEENITSLIETPRGGLLTIGAAGAIWSASNGIKSFIQSINAAYKVDESRSFIMLRLIVFGLTIGLMITLVVSIAAVIFGNMILHSLISGLGLGTIGSIILQIVRWTVTIIILVGLLTILYRFAPNKHLPLKHIIPGALIASLLWLIISFAFSFYVDNFGNYSEVYGSLGGIIILMLWFFITGMILMVGAIVNVLLHENHLKSQQFTNNELKKASEG